MTNGEFLSHHHTKLQTKISSWPFFYFFSFFQIQISIFPVRDDKQPIKLSMVEDAVDDIYNGCNETMEEMVKNKYFMEENTGKFADLWNGARKCAVKSLNKKEKEDERLTNDHMQAICLYTSNLEFAKGKTFYQHFNGEVRTMRTNYSTFKFKSLHFWLTSAIKILSNDKQCLTTYRRTSDVFTGKVGQKIRFGFFASSSFKSILNHFGKKTCFKIKTCSGAFLKHYSYLSREEDEVLIPPYEMFKIMKNTFVEGLGDCEKVYVLESAGTQSNLNCHAVKQN